MRALQGFKALGTKKIQPAREESNNKMGSKRCEGKAEVWQMGARIKRYRPTSMRAHAQPPLSTIIAAG
jgi:hypothetical protein